MGEMCCSLTAATSVVAIILVVLVCQLPIANSEIVSSDTAAGTLGSVQNITLPEQINQMLDFFSARKLAENWMVISDVLTRNCSNDMESYLQGLSEHAIWAMKSEFGRCISTILSISTVLDTRQHLTVRASVHCSTVTPKLS